MNLRNKKKWEMGNRNNKIRHDDLFHNGKLLKIGSTDVLEILITCCRKGDRNDMNFLKINLG